MKKYSLIAFTIAVMMAFMTACGGTGGEQSSTSSEGSDHKTEASAEQAGSKKEEAETPVVRTEPGTGSTIINEDGSRLVYKIVYGEDNVTYHYVYDLVGRLSARETMYAPGEEPYNTRTYTYDEFGHILHWEDEWGAEGRYNEDGVCVFSRSEDGDVRERDEQGNVTHWYDADDVLHHYYTYDEQGRELTEEVYAGREDDPYGEYRGKRELVYSEDGSEMTQYEYNAEGVLFDYAGGYEEKQRYDEAGRLIYRTLPSRKQENYIEYHYTYDEAGRCSMEQHLFNGQYGEEKTWAYDAEGNLLERTLYSPPGKDYHLYERDADGKLLAIRFRNESDGVMSLEYLEALNEYDDRGNIKNAYTFEDFYDSSTGEMRGSYEVYGLEQYEKRTEYIYDYDEDPAG